MAHPILQVENLVKTYGEVQAVRGVSFEVQEGEVFALLGPNGAGKTSTV
ncbi:MAG: ATP-binding cassette domain-containing protein, partial [Steroidobacteraceae bacterium]